MKGLIAAIISFIATGVLFIMFIHTYKDLQQTRHQFVALCTVVADISKDSQQQAKDDTTAATFKIGAIPNMPDIHVPRIYLHWDRPSIGSVRYNLYNDGKTTRHQLFGSPREQEEEIIPWEKTAVWDSILFSGKTF